MKINVIDDAINTFLQLTTQLMKELDPSAPSEKRALLPADSIPFTPTALSSIAKLSEHLVEILPLLPKQKTGELPHRSHLEPAVSVPQETTKASPRPAPIQKTQTAPPPKATSSTELVKWVVSQAQAAIQSLPPPKIPLNILPFFDQLLEKIEPLIESLRETSRPKTKERTPLTGSTVKRGDEMAVAKEKPMPALTRIEKKEDLVPQPKTIEKPPIEIKENTKGTGPSLPAPSYKIDTAPPLTRERPLIPETETARLPKKERTLITRVPEVRAIVERGRDPYFELSAKEPKNQRLQELPFAPKPHYVYPLPMPFSFSKLEKKKERRPFFQSFEEEEEDLENQNR